MTAPDLPILAAGGVLWRRAPDGAVEVALVHRPRYRDWSLPKGHVKLGEHRAVAAVREIVEETGHHAVLGRYLGRTRYQVAGHGKRVDYWSACAVGGGFTPNDEVDELHWLPVADARNKVSQPLDAAVLGRFEAHPATTDTFLLVRHGKAGRRRGSQVEDRLRPLVGEGERQAEALVALCRAFGASEVHAADRVRCVQTVQPLAEALGVTVVAEPSLSEEGWREDPARGAHRAQSLLAAAGVSVLCSQGGVIPSLLAHWAEISGLALSSTRTRKASTWVVSTMHGHVVAMDHLADPFH